MLSKACIKNTCNLIGKVRTLIILALFSLQMNSSIAQSATSICGTIHNDVNCNGKVDNGETVVSGGQVKLFDGAGTLLESTTTDAGGYYCFNSLAAGEFTLTTVNQNGWTQTFPPSLSHKVNLNGGQEVMGIDFLNCQQSTSSICGNIFYDKNCDEKQSYVEPNLENWKIQLTDVQGGVITTYTDAAGYYCFTNLAAGTYILSQVNQAFWVQSFPLSGSYTVTLDMNQEITGFSFGNCYDCSCELGANFAYCVTGCKVSFNDLSSGNKCSKITSWRWDFGDGSFSDLQNPDYAYISDGLYNVCLTVSGDNDVEDCSNKTCYKIDVRCLLLEEVLIHQLRLRRLQNHPCDHGFD